MLRERLVDELGRFKGATGVSLRLEDFLKRFPVQLLATPTSRTIISAFYVFILEADEVNEQLAMRSSAGGSLVRRYHYSFEVASFLSRS